MTPTTIARLILVLALAGALALVGTAILNRKPIDGSFDQQHMGWKS